MTLAERWTDVDKLLQPAPKSEQELRERFVQDVAQARFEFPTTELPSYRTFVNVPEVTLPVKDAQGKEWTPDIVVVDTPGNILKILAQVETASTVTIETRWTDVDKMLQPAPKDRDELRQRAVQDVAKARFEFPTPELASYRTYVNVPEVTLPVKDPKGNELTPDIVVVDTPGNILKILAQVELPEQVTEERAKGLWLPFSKLPDAAFYLYVPVGHGAAAKRLCKKLHIDVYGFRTWRYVPQGIEINDISEPPDVMVQLMPPIVRRILRGV